MSLVQTVHLTMGNYKSPMVVPAVQNDTDRQIKMIVDDFTLSNSMTGKMTFKRADGTFYEAEATLALAENAFTAELDQALTCTGRTLCQLKVTDTDTISTFAFIVWVEADTSGALTPQEGISLIQAVERAEDAADRAEAAAESGGGLTENIKNALLQIARKVAYIDEHGQDYYDDLYDALYEVTGLTLDVSSISLGTIGATSQITATTVPSGAAVTWVSSDTSVATVVNGLVTAVGYGSATITASAGNLTAQCSVVIAQATVTSISVVYTPSATIYETNIPALDTLKNDLVVTATWSNGTTSTVTDYALSGTLSAGSNTVTVSYGGQTTTITVTVVALSSISAVYTQSGTVYDTASLDDLKADLVVTANFADSTTQTVTGYTLSGTLTEGTSTITVSYAGKTTTFNVTVSGAPQPTTISTDDKVNPAFGFISTVHSIPAIYSDDGETEITVVGTGRSAIYQLTPMSQDVDVTVTFYTPSKGYLVQHFGSADNLVVGTSNSMTVYNCVKDTGNPQAETTKTYTVHVEAGQRLVAFNLYDSNPYTAENSYAMTATWME